jgi:GNAT superfamily N-acetyltransferase
MNIVPLSQENLEETIAMINAVFPDDLHSANPPELGLRKSLSLWVNETSWHSITKGRDLARFDYWVVLDEITQKVIGLTGLYAFKDAVNEAWLGWFGVAEIARGKGLGKKLLEWTMNKAREEGYTVFKLYTTTDPNEAAAQKLYENLGLKVVQEVEEHGSQYKTLYRQCDLK